MKTGEEEDRQGCEVFYNELFLSRDIEKEKVVSR